MQHEYSHSSRRQTVVSALFLFMVSYIGVALTNRDKHFVPNLYTPFNDIVAFASDSWRRPIDKVAHHVRQQRHLQKTPPIVEVKGELRKWHKVTLAIQGPMASENNLNDNPFTNYRLDVTFSHALTGSSYKVPGYYAADGNSANTGAEDGNIWYVHFAPNETGEWKYTIDFQAGFSIAIQPNKEGAPVFPAHTMTETINISPTNKTGRDHRGMGRLQYVGKHHMQFQETRKYFLKAGSNSPENFLAYQDFDNTPNNKNLRKSWEPHVKHYVEGVDPVWQDDKGKGIIGAINYLSNQGMNAFSFLTMNVLGDDKNVYPYISPTDLDRFDVSKLAQWEIVFEHADKMGMMLHFITFEQENDQLLDSGDLGSNRKLYYRELVARFSHHLALTWNLGEEISNTIEQIKTISNYVKSVDPYDHIVVAHNTKFSTFLGGILGTNSINGISLQAPLLSIHADTLSWLQMSENANQKWIVSNDEQGTAKMGVLPDTVDPTHDPIRQNALWGNLMAGGAGVEYYFGYSYENSDLTCQDYASREIMWQQSKYALDFFRDNQVPFQDMMSSQNLNSLSSVKLPQASKDWLLSLPNSKRHVLYRKVGNASGGTLTGFPVGKYDVKWFNPRTGGALQRGSVISFTVVNSSNNVIYGTPPSTPTLDWVAHIRKA